MSLVQSSKIELAKAFRESGFKMETNIDSQLRLYTLHTSSLCLYAQTIHYKLQTALFVYYSAKANHKPLIKAMKMPKDENKL